MSDDTVPFERGRIPIRGKFANTWISVEAAADIALLPMLADHCSLSVDELLDQMYEWSRGVGLPYGLVVDRTARTVSLVGDRHVDRDLSRWPAGEGSQ